MKCSIVNLAFARQVVPVRTSARGHDTMRDGHLRLLPGIGPRTPRPVRCDRRPQPRPLVRTGLEQSHGTLMHANSKQSAKVVFLKRRTTFANWTSPSFITGEYSTQKAYFQLRRVWASSRPIELKKFRFDDRSAVSRLHKSRLASAQLSFYCDRKSCADTIFWK